MLHAISVGLLFAWPVGAVLAALFIRGAKALEQQQQWLDSVQVRQPESI